MEGNNNFQLAISENKDIMSSSQFYGPFNVKESVFIEEIVAESLGGW